MRRVLLSPVIRTCQPAASFTPKVLSSRLGGDAVQLVSSSLCYATFQSLSHVRRLSTSPDTNAVANTSRDGVVGHPIDFDINSRVEGNESQIVTVTLEPGQVLRAESGAMMYMTNGVEMNTTTG